MSLTLYKRSKIWHIRGSVTGVRVRESTRTSSHEEAQIIKASRETQIHRQAIYGAECETNFAHAALAYLEAGRDHRFVAQILDQWEDRKITSIKPGHVHDLAKKLYPRAKPSTWNRQVLTPVSAIINFAAQRGLCHSIKINRYPVPKPVRKAIDRIWIDRFMEHGTCPWIGPCALFMFTTAARIGEALSLTPADFDLSKRVGFIERTKNEDPRFFYLTSELVTLLAALEPRNDRVFGFSSPNGAFRKHWRRTIERAGIEFVTPHEAGRHSFATEAIVRNGIDIPTVAHAGNWKSHSLLSQTYAHPENHHDFAEQVFGKEGQMTQNGHKSRKGSVRYVDFNVEKQRHA